MLVAPRTGAWIEISLEATPETPNLLSLPARERGLKFLGSFISFTIETVAPRTGAWTEILLPLVLFKPYQSLPARERGLKSELRLLLWCRE